MSPHPTRDPGRIRLCAASPVAPLHDETGAVIEALLCYAPMAPEWLLCKAAEALRRLREEGGL